MSVYTNNGSFRDEWEMIPIYGKVNIEIIADGGYRARYPAYETRIENYMQVIQQKYLTDFGILIDYSEVGSFTSYGDSCKNSAYTASCNCVSESSCNNSLIYDDGYTLKAYHHKNIYNIAARIPRPDLNDHTTIAFIGHNICYNKPDETHHVVYTTSVSGYMGISWKNIGLAVMHNFISSDSELEVLIHELGHWYDAPDHDGYFGNKSTEQMNAEYGWNKFDNNCIYGRNKMEASVIAQLTICEGCKEVIKNRRDLYNHE